MAQASSLRGIGGIDRDGDGNATFDEISNAARDRSLNPVDRAVADYLDRHSGISSNVADQDKWNSARDTGVTQNDLNFEADSSKSESWLYRVGMQRSPRTVSRFEKSRNNTS